MFILFILIQNIAYSLDISGPLSIATYNNINKTEDSKNYESFEIDLKIHHNFKTQNEFKMQFAANKYLSNGIFLWDFTELYGRNSSKTFTYGKQILDWSNVDSLWKLGLLNKRKNFSIYDPENSGLILLNYEKNIKKIKVNIISSYLYLPELYPAYTISDNAMVCSAIHCKYDLRRVQFSSGKVAPIKYYMSRIKPEDIIFRPTLGLNLEYKEFSTFYFYKPENRLRIKTNSYLDSLDPNGVSLGVEVDFNILNHHLFGFNYRKNIEELSFFISNINTIPIVNKNDFQDSYITAEDTAFKEYFFSLGLTYETDFTAFTISYLNEIKQDYMDHNEEVPITEIPSWFDAALAHMAYKFTDHFLANIKYQHNFPTKDNLIDGNISYNFYNRLAITTGIQLIKSKKDNSYWWSYQSYDQSYLKLSYKF